MGKMTVALLALAMAALGAQQAMADGGTAKEAYWRGVRHERTQDYARAKEAYKASLKADPDFYWSLDRLGACEFYLGDRAASLRSEERRVGKECRSRWSP